MNDIITWIDSLIDFPQLSFLKYIIAGALLLVFVDAFISLLMSGVNSIFRGR